MIKAKLADGSILIGLTDANWKKLKQGNPIMFDLASIGLPSQLVYILGGTSTQEMEKMLRNLGMFDENTRRVTPEQTGN